MVRRTAPRRKTDERVFPVRMRIRGINRPDWVRWNDAEAWLRENVGLDSYALHGGGHEINLYLRTAEAAYRFTQTFPHFEMLDLTNQADHLRAARGR
jgi:hypothetical protein